MLDFWNSHCHFDLRLITEAAASILCFDKLLLWGPVRKNSCFWSNSSAIWLVFFIVAFAASYPLTFLAFGKEPTLQNFIIELLPVLAMIIITVSLRLGSAKAVRFLGLFSSPMWLIYNVFSGSIGAIASEILNLISMIIGIIRLDIKRGKKDDTNT